MYFGENSVIRYVFCKCFHPVYGLSFHSFKCLLQSRSGEFDFELVSLEQPL